MNITKPIRISNYQLSLLSALKTEVLALASTSNWKPVEQLQALLDKDESAFSSDDLMLLERLFVLTAPLSTLINEVSVLRAELKRTSDPLIAEAYRATDPPALTPKIDESRLRQDATNLLSNIHRSRLFINVKEDMRNRVSLALSIALGLFLLLLLLYIHWSGANGQQSISGTQMPGALLTLW